MTKYNDDFDAVTHFEQVEKDAEALIEKAKKESSELLGKARASADVQFTEKLNPLLRKLDEEFSAGLEKEKLNHKKELDDYQASLKKISQNKQSFNKFLDNILF